MDAGRCCIAQAVRYESYEFRYTKVSRVTIPKYRTVTDVAFIAEKLHLVEGTYVSTQDSYPFSAQREQHGEYHHLAIKRVIFHTNSSCPQSFCPRPLMVRGKKVYYAEKYQDTLLSFLMQ